MPLLRNVPLGLFECNETWMESIYILHGFKGNNVISTVASKSANSRRKQGNKNITARSRKE